VLVPLNIGIYRTDDVLSSTHEDRGAVRKSGPVRCVGDDGAMRYLTCAGNDKMLRAWEVEGSALLSERFVSGYIVFKVSGDIVVALGYFPRNPQESISGGIVRLSSSLISLGIFSGTHDFEDPLHGSHPYTRSVTPSILTPDPLPKKLATPPLPLHYYPTPTPRAANWSWGTRPS
jgi:hypothetical protein